MSEGINTENVGRFFRDHVEGAHGELAFELLSGGRSNLTYRVRGEGRSWVLRRPPLCQLKPHRGERRTLPDGSWEVS